MVKRMIVTMGFSQVLPRAHVPIKPDWNFRFCPKFDLFCGLIRELIGSLSPIAWWTVSIMSAWSDIATANEIRRLNIYVEKIRFSTFGFVYKETGFHIQKMVL